MIDKNHIFLHVTHHYIHPVYDLHVMWLFIVICMLLGIPFLAHLLYTIIKTEFCEIIKFQAKNIEIKTKNVELQATNNKLLNKDIEIKDNNIELQTIRDKLQTTDNKLQDKDIEIKTKDIEIKDKNIELQVNSQQIATLKAEKTKIEVKYLKKLKAWKEKKKNLAKYRQIKKENRKHKTIAEEAAEILGVGYEWLAHSSSVPKSNKIGKPLGGKGAGRSRPEKIHKEFEMHPIICDNCQTELKNQKSYIAYDTVITELFHELDDVGCYKYRQLKNVLKKVYRKKCPNCNKWVYPELGLFSKARFGVSFVCYVISERIQTRMPYKMIIEEIRRNFGREFSLSETAIINWFKKFENQLKVMYDQLEALLKEEEFIHIDETGLPMNGENWWLWVLCTANIVLFKMSESRGHQSIEDILKGFEGTIIADFFSAYNCFKDNEHQKCLAHLLSAIIEIVIKHEKENERIKKALTEHQKVVHLEKEAQDPTTPKKRGRPPKLKKLTETQLEVLYQRKKINEKTLRQGIKLGAFFKKPFNKESPLGWENALPNRMASLEAQNEMMKLVEEIRLEDVESDEIRKILNRCEKYKETLFTYLDNEGMPPDNNEAERDLRHFAVQRRISGGFKSPLLMEHFTVYLSLYMTCKTNLKDFELLLTRVLSKEGVDLRSFLVA